MSYHSGPYILNGIPGFDASKGERILKAFQKLMVKFEDLKQGKLSEKVRSSKSRPVAEEELSVTHIQYKIILLQLQFIRNILRKDSAAEQSSSTIYRSALETPLPMAGPFSAHNMERGLNTETQDADHKETQTGHSLIGDVCDDEDDSNRNEERSPGEGGAMESGVLERGEVESGVVESGVVESGASGPSRPTHAHYRLKLDDVPFILGASSSASHSVVANVQGIIAMMKHHNKALCGTKKHTVATSSVASRHSEAQDNNKLIKTLSKDLSDLAQKQEKLQKMIDNAQKSQFSETKSANNATSIGRQKNIEPQSVTKSSMEKPLKETKQFLKTKRTDSARPQETHSVPVVRTLPVAMGTQPARNRLLRSLQDFKTHLSEEDLTWN